jgi:hypothetical protein
MKSFDVMCGNAAAGIGIPTRSTVTQSVQDLCEPGEATAVVLREDQLVIHDDVEDASVAPDQARLDSQLPLDLGRQTGGPW